MLTLPSFFLLIHLEPWEVVVEECGKGAEGSLRKNSQILLVLSCWRGGGRSYEKIETFADFSGRCNAKSP